MSMGYCESENYAWNVHTDCLGEGTFGKVFRGTNKKTGDPVAVKTFKSITQQVSQETKMLQTLQHQYIIQLIATDVEKVSGNLVMILELCNGGSLMQLLNQPENLCGLEDAELLLVLEHLSGGLKYLKRHNVIHRDVKPDNIMRHIMDDGRTIYKLADFGTARELPEGQNFNSLHGTEPYLHPQLYKVCFFRNDNFDRDFGPHTDLWSIGVTLFQIATGYLPFQVHDRHAMLSIYNEMKRTGGIISGIQEKNTDQVVFHKKLPDRSHLSFGLKQLITPIIAGLFIYDSQHQWTFTRYYDEVLELVSRKVINVFYVNKMQMLKIYVKRDDNFDDFRYYVQEQTNIDNNDQIFLYKQSLIVDSVDCDFPFFDSKCVFLIDRNSDVVEPHHATQLVYENLSNFKTKFMNGDTSDDIRLAYIACRDLCFCKHLMEYQSMVYEFFGRFIKNFSQYCRNELKQLRKIYDHLLEKYSSIGVTLKMLEKLQGVTQSDDLFHAKKLETLTNDFVSVATKSFDNLATTKIDSNFDNCHDSYLKIVSKELGDMKNLNKNLMRLKISNMQHYNFEKIKVVHCVHTILDILTDKTEPEFEIFINKIKNWYEHVFVPYLKSLNSLKKHLHCYRCNLKKNEKQIQAQSSKDVNLIVGNGEQSCSHEKLISILTDYQRNNLDIDFLIDESAKIMTNMDDLLIELSNIDLTPPDLFVEC